MSASREDRVKAAVKAIRDFYELGGKLPPKQPLDNTDNKRKLRDAAETLGVSVEFARQARQFADHELGYTPDEVDALCRLIEETQPDQGDELSVFGRSHLNRMLSVPKRRRPRLQAEAIGKGWAMRRLDAEIAARYGARRNGGRYRLPRTKGILGLLTEVERLCDGWMRWHDQLGSPPVEGRAVPLEDLPQNLRDCICAAQNAMEKLEEAVAAAFNDLRPTRLARLRFREDEKKKREP